MHFVDNWLTEIKLAREAVKNGTATDAQKKRLNDLNVWYSAKDHRQHPRNPDRRQYCNGTGVPYNAQ
jgi:hypothetical protein